MKPSIIEYVYNGDGLVSGIHIRIYGTEPATKGSYKVVPAKSKTKPGKTYGRLVPMNAHEHSWRQLIVDTAHMLNGVLPRVTRDYTLRTDEWYYLPRPKSANPKRRVNPNRKPDLDKLERATHDALTDSGLIDDDSIICDSSSHKRYVDNIEDCGLDLTFTWRKNTQ